MADVTPEMFEAESAQEAVAAAREALGPDVALSEPVERLVGGVGGFFAKRRYQVRTVRSVPVEPEPGSIDEAEALLSSGTPTGQVTYAPPPGAQRPAPAATTMAALTAQALTAPPVGTARPSGVEPVGPFAKALSAVQSDSHVQAATARTVRDLPAPLAPVVPSLDAALARALQGVPAAHGHEFAARVQTEGAAAAVSAVMAEHFPQPSVPVIDDGEVLVVIGPDAAVVTAARQVAAALGLPAGQVRAAGSAAVTAQVPTRHRLRTRAAAAAAREGATGPLVVAVETGWDEVSLPVAEVLDALDARQVWASVDATRRVSAVRRWLATQERVDAACVDGLARTDAVTDCLLLEVPVVIADGRPATARRWADAVLAVTA